MVSLLVNDESRRYGLATSVCVLVFTVGLFLMALPVYSQGNLGRITGSVADQSGGAVSGATVTVLDVARGVARTLTTGDSGEFDAPNLLPGGYTVRAEAKGFKRIEQQNILLEVGKEIRVDLLLQPGDLTQTITITEAPPMVETTNATLGGTLSNQTINDLPLNGRNYVDLLPLRPGMILYPGGGGSSRSANGTRAEDIGYLVDGVRQDDPYGGSSVLNAAIAAGDSSTSLPVDAIQEFNTEVNPKAEFGWKPGAIVNAGLKSGTNAIHGTAFAFGRDTALDARNFFNPPPATQAPVNLEQFGASLGGAIKKDKLFYFVDYEGQRYSVGSTLLVGAPATVQLPASSNAKSLVNECNLLNPNHSPYDGSDPKNKVTALSAQLAGLTPSCTVNPTNYTPGPSESLFPSNTSTTYSPILLGLVSINSQNNGVAKVDYHINDKHTLSGMYFNAIGGGDWNDAASQVGLPGSSSSPFMSSLFGYIQVASGSWTFTPNSTWVNEARVGYIHYRQWYDSLDSTVNPVSYGINTGVTDPRYFGFPIINITGFSNFRLGAGWPKHTGPDSALEFLDHIAVLKGKHAFKFGGEAIANSADPFITANAKGSFRFSNLANFLQGVSKTSGSLSTLLVGDPARQLSNDQFAVFFQDDWRLTQKLVLNLGVRYELNTVLKDANGKLGNFDPSAPTGFVQVNDGEPSAYHGDHRDFSPRVGFAWDIHGNGKTVLRGGASVMYEQLPYSTFIAVGNTLGLNQVPTGATQVFCSVNPCKLTATVTPTQIVRQGIGTINVESVSVSGGAAGTPNTLIHDWQAQTAACLFNTNCGPIFPTTIFAQQCGDSLTVPGATAADPAPCNTEAVDPNLRNPYVVAWNLTLERAITNDLSLQVAYVGNHGARFLGFQDINQPVVGAGYPGFGNASTSINEVLSCNTAGNPGGFKCDPGDASKTSEQLARPYFSKFPYLAQIDQLSNLDRSNYDGLQVTLTQRPMHGLSFLAGYTFSHSLDEASGNFNANSLPIDSYLPNLQYGNSDFDIRHRFTLSATYALPGKKTPGQMLEGWTINSIVTLQTGGPWSPRDATNDFAGNGAVSELNGYGQPWNLVGNKGAFKATGPIQLSPLVSGIGCWSGSGPSALGSGCGITGAAPPAVCQSGATTPGQMNALLDFGCYVSQNGQAALLPAPIGSIGDAGRNIFVGPGFRDWDMSVTKIWRIKERLTTQFRAEFFNVLNHPIFANPGGPAGAGFNDPSSGAGSTFGCGCNTPDQAAPNPVLGSGANRSIQLGLKLVW